MVTVAVGVAGRAEASLLETVAGQVTAMKATASKAAPGRVQAFRNSQSILRLLIMDGSLDVRDSSSG